MSERLPNSKNTITENSRTQKIRLQKTLTPKKSDYIKLKNKFSKARNKKRGYVIFQLKFFKVQNEKRGYVIF